MKSKVEVVAQFKKHKRMSQSGLSAQYRNNRECWSFYNGDMMDYRDQVQFQTGDGVKKRATVKFNKIKPYVNAIKGFMAQNRRKASYVARMADNPMAGMYSKYANAIADYIRDNANSDHFETQQDGDMLVCGYGAIETAMTFGDGLSSTNPNGEIIQGRIEPNLVGWDPQARHINLLDARWVYYPRQYSVEDAIAMFSDSTEDDFEKLGDEQADDYDYNPRGGIYDKISVGYEYCDAEKTMVNVYFYQWVEVVDHYRAQNPLFTLTNPQAVQLVQMNLDMIAQDVEEFDSRAELLDFDASTKSKLEEMLGEYIQPMPYKKKVYYTAVVSGDKCFNRYKSLSQHGFSIKFKTSGDFDERRKIWTGVVNSLKEPTLYYNKALTELMFIIGTNSKGGVLIEKGAVEDIGEFEAKYAKTDGVVEVNEGALSAGKIQPKAQPQQPTGYEQIISMADSAIGDVSGIDRTFLGSSENKQETALLQRRRLRQITASLACYMDAVTLYQKEVAKLLLDYIRIFAENNHGMLLPLIGEDGRRQFVPLASDKIAGEYDVSIEEAPQTPDEKLEFAQVLTGLGDKLLAAGDPTGKMIYGVALKYMPIDEEDKLKVQQMLNPQQQEIDPNYVKQLEAQLQAVQNEASQATIQKLLSEVNVNKAKIDQIRVQMQKDAALTTKTLEETQQLEAETHLMQNADVVRTNINV